LLLSTRPQCVLEIIKLERPVEKKEKQRTWEKKTRGAKAAKAGKE
jgi:hypothetical protein